MSSIAGHAGAIPACRIAIDIPKPGGSTVLTVRATITVAIIRIMRFVLTHARSLPLTVCLLATGLTLNTAAWGQDNAAVAFTVTGFDVTGEAPVEIEDTDSLLAPFLGEHGNTEGLQNAADTLEKAFHDLGYTFVRVVIPRQPLDDGTIELSVVSFVLDKISIAGNAYFDEENIRASLPSLVAGESPNRKHLARNLDAGRIHPSRKEKITFKASTIPGKVDASVQVSDRKPISFFTWLNNTGTEETGEYRMGVGFQHSNLFNRDHNATLTYTTSPTDTDKVDQIGAVYQVPLYESGALLTALVSESDVNSGRVAEFFDVAGQGSVRGLQYTKFFSRNEGFAQKLVFGVNDKLFDNDIDFDGQPIGNDVRSRPWSLQYRGDFRNERGESDFYIEYVENLSGGSFNNDQFYAASRQGASSNWSLVRYGAGTRKTAGKWTLSGRFKAQHASEPLIAGEQFGLGGAHSVRGLREREVAGDKGYQVQLEAVSPKLGKHNARGILFLEGGSVSLVEPLPGELSRDRVMGLGAGVTWSWRGKLTARVDLAYVPEGTDAGSQDGTRDGDERVHFNLAYKW
jgi:hemolysin activation/secretion protein